MYTLTLLAATESKAEESGLPLGISLSAFLIQLATFVLIFLLLRKFAFKKIIAVLEERRKTIEDGVRLGHELHKEKEKLEQEHAEKLRKARKEADSVIAAAHEEAGEVLRGAEDSAQRKVDTLLSDAHRQIEEDAARARRDLEKDVINLVADATEVLIGEKIDPKKDAALIDKALKGRAKV